jgi:hypothetical protein
MTNIEKLQAAIDWLGPRYVLHPSRRIPRGNYEPEVIRTNLRETFDRVAKRMTGELPLVQVAR